MDVISRDGHEKLLTWFGLSYASYAVLPRILMQEMPDDWQGKMADLLKQYYDEFPNQPDLGTRVLITKNGKLVKTPDYLLNYRHPDPDIIKIFRGNGEWK